MSNYGVKTNAELVEELIDIFPNEFGEAVFGHEGRIGDILIELDDRFCDGKNKREIEEDQKNWDDTYADLERVR